MKLLKFSCRTLYQIDGSTVPCALYLDDENNVCAKTSRRDGGLNIPVKEISASDAQWLRDYLRNNQGDISALEREYPDDKKGIIRNLWDILQDLGGGSPVEEEDLVNEPA